MMAVQVVAEHGGQSGVRIPGLVPAPHRGPLHGLGADDMNVGVGAVGALSTLDLRRAQPATRRPFCFMVQTRRGQNWEPFIWKPLSLGDARSLAVFLNETDTGWYRAKKITLP
ncbi:MAG: hypothetical protein ABSE73_00105 [Planctomycetota bacterium]